MEGWEGALTLLLLLLFLLLRLSEQIRVLILDVSCIPGERERR